MFDPFEHPFFQTPEGEGEETAELPPEGTPEGTGDGEPMPMEPEAPA